MVPREVGFAVVPVVAGRLRVVVVVDIAAGPAAAAAARAEDDCYSLGPPF